MCQFYDARRPDPLPFTEKVWLCQTRDNEVRVKIERRRHRFIG